MLTYFRSLPRWVRIAIGVLLLIVLTLLAMYAGGVFQLPAPPAKS